MELSKILDIKGVGPSLAERIKKTLDVQSVEELASFSEEQLSQVRGIGSGKAKKISEQLEGLSETCERCGEKYVGAETCPNCTEELKEELEQLKEEVESLEKMSEKKRHLEESVKEIEVNMNEGEIQQGFKLLKDTKDELSEVEKKEEFTKISDLKGVGPTFVERIKETLEVSSAEELASFDKEDLKEVKGIGEGKAQNISDQLDSFREECQRCSDIYIDEESCPNCREELKEKLELSRDVLESLKEDLDQTERWDLDKRLEEIESKIQQGEFKVSSEMLESASEELAEAEEVSKIILDIKQKLEKQSEVINLDTYKEGIRSAERSLRYGKYREGRKKIEKITDYLENEKKYRDMEDSQLLGTNIEEFSKDMMGVGLRDGEMIYGEGFHNLKDVYKAGAQKLISSGIDEKTSERLVGILESMFHDLEIERELGEEEPLEEELESKEDVVFEEAEEKEMETKIEREGKTESEEGKIEEEEVVEEKPPEEPEEIEETGEVKSESTEEVPSTEDLFGEDIAEEQLGEVDEEEVGLKYWIPAILIPILLAIVGYLLFFM